MHISTFSLLTYIGSFQGPVFQSLIQDRLNLVLGKAAEQPLERARYDIIDSVDMITMQISSEWMKIFTYKAACIELVYDL
jgi:hypothetical protein